MSSVLLVDDHPAVLLGLECIFAAQPDLDVVATCQDSRDAAAVFARTRPDVVVLDLSMAGLGGEQVLGELRAIDPQCRVLVLTSNIDSAAVRRVISTGADGYQLKDSPPDSLLDAVRSVLRGESPIDPRVTRALFAATHRADKAEVLELTDREQDVLRLVGEGLANKQIASRLGIGVSTVKTHLSSVFQQIGVTDRTSAALWARSHLPEQAAC